MIFLDSHIVVWLYAGATERLTRESRQLLLEHVILISPIVRLELQYLHEIERVTIKPDEIITDLSFRVGLQVSEEPFDRIISLALKIEWTRDPFDRIIVAQAALDNHRLLTKDQTILKNYKHAVW